MPVKLAHVLDALVTVAYSGYGGRLAGDFPEYVEMIERDGDALLITVEDGTEYRLSIEIP